MSYERILIAESDAHLAEMMVIRLSNAGYQVTVTDKGDEVLTKAIGFEASVVILDQFLPSKEGFEVCYELRMNPKTRRIGILLLVEQELDLRGIAKLGVRIDGQLIKPFNPKEALTKVNQIVSRQRASELNSLAGFQGWEALKREIRDRLSSNGLFDLLFINISNFRIYNRCYGFDAGDEVIRMLARIIMEVTDTLATPDVFLAHILGDEFAVMLPAETGYQVGREIINRFDQEILEEYLEEDRERGGLVIKNRNGQLEQKPLMSLAVALVNNLQRGFNHPLEVKVLGEELLAEVKKQPGSNLIQESNIG